VNSIHDNHDPYQPARWIGVDLNTTGHAVVAADLVTGRIMKLGKRLQFAPNTSMKKCTKLYREGKLWKTKKMKTRERKAFKATLNKISRQIVSFAESSCAGIKFEKLFTYRYLHHKEAENPYEFSFENDSFLSLLHLIEKRALSRGIPVLYVNPTNTSKRCSRCGSLGRRFRKRFECPHCGAVIHADVNAAFNIAATPHNKDRFEIEWMRMTRREIRRKAKTIIPMERQSECVRVLDLSSYRAIFDYGETLQMIQDEG
jgi:putative transposase